LADMRQSVVTCQDLFALPLLTDAVLLAGKEGLHRQVRRVNVMEVPDVTDWVQSGEFLMTTGYPLRDNPHTFVELIRQLSAKGVVALGIKTKRFVDIIPPEVITVADALKFPLIELPPQTIFSEIIHEVMELVLAHEMFQLTILQERMQAITSVMMDGGGIIEMLQELERLFNHHVLFLDTHADVLVTDKTASVLQETIEPSRMWSQNLIAEMERVAASNLFGELQIQQNEGAYAGYFCKIQLSYGRRCYLLLLNRGSQLLDIDKLTIDRIKPIVVLELMNLEARRSVEHKYLDQFLQDWLFARLDGDAEWKMRAKLCGFEYEESNLYAVAVLRNRHNESNQMPIPSTVIERFQALREQSDGLMFQTLLLDEQIVWFIGVPQEIAEMGNLHLRKRIEKQIHSEIFQHYFVQLGKIVRTNEVFASYSEALKIQQISLQSGLNHNLLTYDDLGVYPLLTTLPDCDELQHFRKKFIEPLLAFEKTHHLNIIETLDTYFQCNQNMKSTAEKLFTHYNTIVYRMDRIKNLLGFDLDQADVRLQLHLALKLYRLDLTRKQASMPVWRPTTGRSESSNASKTFNAAD
jgi:purine catabolism regulator